MRARITGEKNYVYVVYEENGKFIEKACVLTPDGDNPALRTVLVAVGALLAGAAVITVITVITVARLIAKKHKSD